MAQVAGLSKTEVDKEARTLPATAAAATGLKRSEFEWASAYLAERGAATQDGRLMLWDDLEGYRPHSEAALGVDVGRWLLGQFEAAERTLLPEGR